MLTDVRNDDNTKGEDKLKSKHKKTKGKKSHKHKKREEKHMKWVVLTILYSPIMNIILITISSRG